jgi:hypothetical protein
MVQVYDKELVLPLLMKVSQFLPPHYSRMPIEIEQIYDGSLFWCCSLKRRGNTCLVNEGVFIILKN